MSVASQRSGSALLRGARLLGAEDRLQDLEIRDGVIAAVADTIEPARGLSVVDVGGRLVSPGLVETHIHLDKAMIIDRVSSSGGDIDGAISEVAKLKGGFTPEDVHDRAAVVLEKSLRQGTTQMRTHLEVDPVIGLRSLDGIWPLIDEYAWALDLEICVFPQEGLLNNPGTDELIVRALERGAHAVGGAPYTDTDPRGQIDRIFEIAREFDVDIDMHFDFGSDPDGMDLFYLCDQTEKHAYGGRVTIGHVTKLAAAPPDVFVQATARLAEAGVALTVLPATDLYLMGRDRTENKTRGVVEAHRLVAGGVNCSLSTNNLLNPFTPLGDASLIRMANLYANVAHVGSDQDFRECFNMISSRAARLLNLDSYGLEVGKAADLVVFEARSAREAVSTLAPVVQVLKRGLTTVCATPPQVCRP